MKTPLAILFCSLLLTSQANAQVSYVNSKDLGTFTTATTSQTVSYPVGSSSSLLKVLVTDFTDTTNAGAALSVTAGGKAMTAMSCSGSDSANSAGLPFGFYLISPPTGTVSIVVTSGHAIAMQIGAADYARVQGFESCVLNHGTGGTASVSITTKTANDWVMIDTGGYNGQAAGAGDTLRVQDGTYQDWGIFDSNGPLSVGSHSFTTTLSIANSINQIVSAFTPSVTATPKSASCNPSSPTLSQNLAAGATVCAFTVGMSDGSTYSGNNAVSPSSLFAVPSTGNGNLTLARGLTLNDVGSQTAALTFSQNGSTITLNVPVSVISCPGLVGIAWPLSSAVNYQPVYIANGQMYVCSVSGVVEQQAAGGQIGIYTVPSGTPCKTVNGIQGTSLLAPGAYFDTNVTPGQSQNLPLSQNNALVPGAVICIDDLSGANYSTFQGLFMVGIGS